MTLKENKIARRLGAMLNCRETFIEFVDAYNGQLEEIKKIVNRENEDNTQ